ncbi:MAG: LCP family protein [Candidatus Peregrinibacteria bacterium]|nr:LCP family protein [Candidatus Peregrinibacteria bacterium]
MGLARFFRGLPPQTKNYIIAGILVLIGLFVVIKVTTAAYRMISGFSPKDLILAAGADLEKDKHGYTNVVLLGDGGHERDGADLIDTIMVASIDFEKNAVSLFSIPRDYYVRADGEFVTRSGRINELYRNHKYGLGEEGAYDLFRRAAGDVVNLDIQYYVRIDFRAFVDIVDSLGGITVDVQEEIYDPYYPNETDTGYVTFVIDEGLQEMDGETALKYVRSRKTTSDFDRAARQQLVIDAVQQKALSKDVLGSAGKLKDMYSAVSKNINTNLSTREMIALAGFAKRFDRSHLVRKLIHDDPGQEGGFLYTPEREEFNDQFVLIPFGGDLELIHKYADLVFHQREVFYDPPLINILNATPIAGVARNSAYQLIRFGFDVQEIDNYFDEDGEKKYLERSLIQYTDYIEGKDGLVEPIHQGTLSALQGFVKGAALPSGESHLVSEEHGKKTYDGGRYDITIILGEDYDVFLVK